MRRRLYWITVHTVIVLLLVVTGCTSTAPQTAAPDPQTNGGTEEESSAGAEVEEPDESEASESGEQTALDGELIYVLPSDIASLDPHNTTETVSGIVNSQMFDYLVDLQPDGSVGPALATSWGTSEDGTTWTFELREDVTFHDGTPFNAQAVETNLERILNEDNGLPSLQLVRGITDVNVVDDFTIEFVTESPFGPLPHHLTHYSLGMISPAALESMSSEELAQNPIGTGPFEFVRYTPNESIALQAHTNYWGEGPNVASLAFRPVPESSSRSVLLETGEAHIVSNIVPQDVDSLQTVDGVRVDVEPFTRVIFAHMNGSREPFDQVEVRQALSYALNREAIVDNILQGFASVARGPLGAGVFGYAETEGYDYDPERARQTLADAGYPDGFSATMLVPAGRYQGAEEAAQAVQAQLAEVGVDIDLQVIEFATLLEQIRVAPEDAEWDMVVLGFGPATNDADWQLYSQFHSNSWAPLSNNRSFYSNETVDRLLEEGRFSTDPEQRQAAYAEILEIINNDAPELYFYQTTQIYGVNDSVSGLEYLPIDIQNLHTVTIQD